VSNLRRSVRILSAFVPIVFTLFSAPSARAIVYTATVVNTPLPNWVLGNPQPAEVGVCSLLGGGCLGNGNLENADGIAILVAPATFGAYTLNGDTLAQEALGVVGADVRVPNAYWLSPVFYTWGAGGVFFFNSVRGGVAYANELVLFDPPDFSTALTDILPTLSDLPVIVPTANTTLSPDESGNVTIPNPMTEEAPEPAATLMTPLGAGLLMLLRARRRGRS